MTKKDPINCPACQAGLPLVRRYVTVTDTSRLPTAEKLAVAGLPGGGIAQEARGHKDDPTASTEPGCVCADCGHEQSTMEPCERCRSVRVVLVTVVRDLFGENWRDAFNPSKENA